MRRVSMIAALIITMLAPAHGSMIHARHGGTTRVHLMGTGIFSGSADCSTLSGIFDFTAKARFEDGQFIEGEGTGTIYQVDGTVARLIGPNSISLTSGSLAVDTVFNSRVELRGSFVSPLNNGTYNVVIEGIVDKHVGP